MSKTDTFMPMYIGDILRDTGYLTPAEFGSYHYLIYAAWTSGGLLPAESNKLRVLSRMSVEQWAESGDTLMAFFQRVEGGYRHKRVDLELAKAAKRIEGASTAGKASANKRWGNRTYNGNVTPAITPVITTVTNELPLSDNAAMPLHLHLQEEERKKEEPLLSPLTPKPVAQRAPKNKPRTQLSDEWRPNMEGIALLHKRGLPLEETFLRFRDYHRSKGNLMASWDAAWGTWCRSPYNAPKAMPGAKTSSQLRHEATQARIAEITMRSGGNTPDFAGTTIEGELI